LSCKRITRNYILKDSAALPSGSCKATARLAGLNPATIYTAVKGNSIGGASAEKIAAALGKPIKELFEPIERNEGLDAVTVTDVRRAVSSIFAVAVKKEIVVKNPARNSTPPKTEAKTKLFLDDNQCKQLLSILEDEAAPQLRTMLTTLMYTGMRSGELLALKWEAVDFDTGVITIRHTLYHIKGEYKLSTPKTKSSGRAVKVPVEILTMLKKHKIWQTERRLALSSN
jgi:integrase